MPAPFSFVTRARAGQPGTRQQSPDMVSSDLGTKLAQVHDRALLLESECRLEQARNAYDQALAFDPSLQWAAEGRARMAMALKEPDARRHCARAIGFHDDNPDRQLRMIVTVATELGFAAIPLLEEFVGQHPQNATAHRYLSELQSEAGAQERSTDNYLSAIEKFPTDRVLRLSYWDTLVRSGRHAQALEAMEATKALFGDDRRYALLKLNIANHIGLKSLASQLLDQLGDRPDTRLPRAQFLLQMGQVDDAGRRLEDLLAAEPDNVSAWAMIEVIWRMLADPRHEWLIGSRRLFDVLEMQLSTTELRGIADALRRLHLGRSQPIGQSVRAGTQTSGQLFLRSDPEIMRLMGAIEEAAGRFVRGLPPVDALHPVLKFRDTALTYGPSWSVRLTEQGFHAAHFHPGGVWSSACYIAVSDNEDVSDRAGWLELGRPPPELGSDLEPLAVLQPKAGRLVLFPSFLFHGTRPFQGEERLTVAFDLVPVSQQ